MLTEIAELLEIAHDASARNGDVSQFTGKGESNASIKDLQNNALDFIKDQFEGIQESLERVNSMSQSEKENGFEDGIDNMNQMIAAYELHSGQDIKGAGLSATALANMKEPEQEQGLGAGK